MAPTSRSKGPLGNVLAALPVVGNIVSAVQGNQNRQRAKGEINKAYQLGQQRLTLRQGDQRRGQAESLVARGLSNGGGRIGRAVGPTNINAWANNAPGYTPTGTAQPRRGSDRTLAVVSQGTPVRPGSARTLGEAQSRDLRSEQQLEQDAMRQQRDAAIAGVDAGYTQALVNAGGNAISGAINAYGAMQPMGGTPAKPDYGKGAFGIDPVSPWGSGYGPQVDDFNVIK